MAQKSRLAFNSTLAIIRASGCTHSGRAGVGAPHRNCRFQRNCRFLIKIMILRLY
jgi:hypothetical protein